MRRRRVFVLNHFAVPAGEPGGTRHTELFSALDGWDHLIVAARTNYTTRRRQGDRPGFRFVSVTPYSSNGLSRIANWGSYAVMAGLTGLGQWRRRPDVVYASSPHLLAAAAGALIATVHRRPLVVEIRDLWPKVLVDMGQLSEDSRLHRLLSGLESTLYQRAAAVVVLAPGVRTTLLERGLPADKVVVIPNAADPSYFDVEEDRATLRRRYGFDRFTIVYAGAHGPANGLDLALAAARECSDLDVDFVLVGDGISKPALQQQAQEMGLTNVRFLDPVPKAEVPGLLRAADVGLHCLADVALFRYGVSPNKVFDYMAAGLPVLTNTPGEVAELVEGAGAGVAVSPDRIADGVAAMSAATPDRLADWGQSGRAWITDHQTRSAMATRLRAVFEGLR